MTLAVTATERATAPWSDRGVLLRRLYRTMAILRRLDLEEIVRGLEANQVGSAAALDPSRDVVFATNREVDGAVTHAVGWALGAKLDRTGGVAIAYVDEGAGSQGDLHEAIDTAVGSHLPIIFFCQSNGRAMPDVRVDGNDVLAVYDATTEAIERARRGGGPTVIEAITGLARDPLALAEEQLRQSGSVDDDFFAEVADAAGDLADRVRQDAAVLGGRAAEALFDFPFSDPLPLLHGHRRVWAEPRRDRSSLTD